MKRWSCKFLRWGKEPKQKLNAVGFSLVYSYLPHDRLPCMERAVTPFYNADNFIYVLLL